MAVTIQPFSYWPSSPASVARNNEKRRLQHEQPAFWGWCREAYLAVTVIGITLVALRPFESSTDTVML